jgi:hypothetical protein
MLFWDYTGLIKLMSALSLFYQGLYGAFLPGFQSPFSEGFGAFFQGLQIYLFCYSKPDNGYCFLGYFSTLVDYYPNGIIGSVITSLLHLGA